MKPGGETTARLVLPFEGIVETEQVETGETSRDAIRLRHTGFMYAMLEPRPAQLALNEQLDGPIESTRTSEANERGRSSRKFGRDS